MRDFRWFRETKLSGSDELGEGTKQKNLAANNFFVPHRVYLDEISFLRFSFITKMLSALQGI